VATIRAVVWAFAVPVAAAGLTALWQMHNWRKADEALPAGAKSALLEPSVLAPPARLKPDPIAVAANATPFDDRLVLTGTLVSNDPTRAVAFIGDSAETAVSYGLNQEILPGWMVREISANRVVVERDGMRRILTIDYGKPGEQAAATEYRAVAMPVRVRTNALSGEVAQDAPQPGVRVFAGRNRAAFAQLGLRPGDIVTDVNGVSVTGDVSEISRALADGEGGTVSVIRSGHLLQLTVPPQAK
jgi:general secretion pathway protein C